MISRCSKVVTCINCSMASLHRINSVLIITACHALVVKVTKACICVKYRQHITFTYFDVNIHARITRYEQCH